MPLTFNLEATRADAQRVKGIVKGTIMARNHRIGGHVVVCFEVRLLAFRGLSERTRRCSTVEHHAHENLDDACLRVCPVLDQLKLGSWLSGAVRLATPLSEQN
jgi:hypothetical protein